MTDRDLIINQNKSGLRSYNEEYDNEEDEEDEKIPVEQEHFYAQINEPEDIDLDLDIDIELEDETDIQEYKTEDERINEEFKIKKIPFPKNMRKDVMESTTPKHLARHITPKQELFCRYYASSVYKGDGFTAYCKAYNFSPMTKYDYATAKSHTTRLLNNTNISRRITQLLKEEGLNRSDVDVELAFIIKQKQDLAAKNKAIDTYYKLTGALKQQVEVSGTVSHKFFIPSNGRETMKQLNPESEVVEGEVEASYEELNDIG